MPLGVCSAIRDSDSVTLTAARKSTPLVRLHWAWVVAAVSFVAILGAASATAIKITPAFLPKRGQYAELRRLARILQVPLSDVTDQIEKHGDNRLIPVVVKEVATRNEVFFLKEHQKEFPGMKIENTSIRRYPHGDLAAHILGYVAEISDQQLDQLKGYKLGDRIGQAGVEASFDKELRGRPGVEQTRVDSLGDPKGPPVIKQLPVPGYGLRLTLDAKLLS